jgi:hypothetical protein
MVLLDRFAVLDVCNPGLTPEEMSCAAAVGAKRQVRADVGTMQRNPSSMRERRKKDCRLDACVAVSMRSAGTAFSDAVGPAGP